MSESGLWSAIKGLWQKPEQKPVSPAPATQPQQVAESPKTPASQEPAIQGLKLAITFDDTKPIRDFEGHSLKAYPDPVSGGDPWTISWGLTGSWVKPGLVLTEDESKARFMEYIGNFCKEIDKLVTAPITKNQYIAILSFAWNVGLKSLANSTLLKLLNAKDYTGAADQFLRWNKAGGKEIAGLTRRRKEERALFLKP